VWMCVGICSYVLSGVDVGAHYFTQEMVFTLPDQCLVCYEVAESWPGKSWCFLIKCYRESQTFAAEWMAARAVHSGGDTTWRNTSSVDFNRIAGMRTESSFWFVSLAEFVTEFGCLPKDISYQTVKVDNEEGTDKIEGIFMKPTKLDPPFKYRTITFFSERRWLQTEQIMPGAKQYREAQAQDYMDHCLATNTASRAPAIMKMGLSCIGVT
jgi:hypothetical protein